MELFAETENGRHEPLAARMRPRKLDEYIGQDHIIGPGRLLRRAIQADQLSSVIFYGPPGTGKTTLARVIANHTKSNFVTLNAVLAGVQQIRESIAVADEQRKLYNRRTILFVDEVHRWNRAQQDALLPWVENGTIILIGATTENPFFEVNKALVSRSRVFQLKALTKDDLSRAARAALADSERGYGAWRVTIDDDALAHLVDTAAGDARSLLNALELAVETSAPSWPAKPGTEIHIDRNTAEESIQKKAILYDRDGDYHYDVISAFIKSLRGRDPDAALYWMARMIAAGEDPHFIFRRMLISACEDTGLADPAAIGIVEACAAAFDRVGMPEGQYHLAQAATYLATCPKSNSLLAYFDALAAVEAEEAEVPNHLRDANRDAKEFGHGKGYIYPHSYREHWAAQQYLPDALVGRVFFNPSVQGHEGRIRDEVLARRELQVSAILAGEAGDDQIAEILTFSPASSRREQWAHRLDSGKSATLLDIRNTVLSIASLARHHRVLVFQADDGLLVWEAGRLVPEGFSAGLCRSAEARDILLQYAENLEELDRPAIESMQAIIDNRNPFEAPFDRIVSKDPAYTIDGILSFIDTVTPLGAPGARVVFSVRVPSLGMRLSRILERAGMTVSADILAAENAVFTDSADARYGWTPATLAAVLEQKGFTAETTEKTCTEYRLPAPADIDRWLDAKRSPLGKALEERVSAAERERFRLHLEAAIAGNRVAWEYRVLFCALDL